MSGAEDIEKAGKDLFEAIEQADSFTEKMENNVSFVIGIIVGGILSIIGNLFIASLISYLNPDKSFAWSLMWISFILFLLVLALILYLILNRMKELKNSFELRIALREILEDSIERNKKTE